MEKLREKILVVDDDLSARESISQALSVARYAVRTASSGSEAFALLEDEPMDLLVTDLSMPGVDGMTVLRRLRSERPHLPFIVVTSSLDVASAIEAMRLGAENYLVKPIEIDMLIVAVERALANRNVREEATELRRQVARLAGTVVGGMVGVSPAMQRVYREAKLVAASRSTVLITGESGTGKGAIAQAIHEMSPRSKMPFIHLHCAALSESVLESELFGHEKGAFTGADKRRMGRFEKANGGTLFLDEVGEISPAMQVKLLRVLQERSFERVGSSEPIHVDVRLLAATNRDLASDVQAGRFREDFYYRLNVVRIELPPLRVRGNDVLLLADHFLAKFAAENGKEVCGFSDEARAAILRSRWHGNVRALENAIERAVVLCESSAIQACDLPNDSAADLQHAPCLGPPVPGATLKDVERYVILKTLEAVGGSTSRAAKILNIGRRTIQYRLHEYGLSQRRSGFLSRMEARAEDGAMVSEASIPGADQDETANGARRAS